MADGDGIKLPGPADKWLGDLSQKASTLRESELEERFSEHPEYFVGGAFAAGVVLAQILRVFGRG